MKKVVSAMRKLKRQGRTPGKAFTDDGIQFVVNSVLVLPQQLHHRVVRSAENKVQISVQLASKCPMTSYESSHEENAVSCKYN